MNKNANYSVLPPEVLLNIFQYLRIEDLYNLQQVCPKFRGLIDDLKRSEIENDWRLDYSKYEKFGNEISATVAIKSLEMAKAKKGKYTITGTFIPTEENRKRLRPPEDNHTLYLRQVQRINFESIAQDVFTEVM